ncbi:MAG: hypothetical protein ACLSBH_16630 [Coprobacillus cateniformis]
MEADGKMQSIMSGSRQYHAYGNWPYTTFVPWGAEIQEHAELLEFLATIAGAANQSYNPYTGAEHGNRER